MPFDATIAIAELDIRSGTDRPDLDALRERYPELGFIFDKLEDKLHEAETAAIEYRDERREVERGYRQEIDELEQRVHDLRFALEAIKELSSNKDVLQIVEDVL